MGKKGFVLIETITVLVVVIVSMLALYKGYSGLFDNFNKKIYYDNINDVYKVNVFKNDITSFSNSSIVKITTSNCASYASSSCDELINELNVDYLLITSTNLSDDIKSSILSNSDIEYIQKLDNIGIRYLILYYAKDGINYYSSLKVGS